MKVLIIGSGAREHAIGVSIAKNESVKEIYFAPGNGGTDNVGKNVDISASDLDSLLKFAKDNNIDYTIAGPEDPICSGIADLFEKNGMKIFAPLKRAAKLEDSKAYAKEFCVRHGIRTAKYLETSEYDEAVDFALRLMAEKGRVVLKADGLCAGKGVVIAENKQTIENFCKEVLEKGNYGKSLMVVEEFLEGFEMSLLCFIDGNTIKPLPTSRDHKKIFKGEIGPNTGGMGTYSPNSSADVYREKIEEEILQPFLKGLSKDNIDYRGLVFIGLMIGEKGIDVLEFNVRFGDPETQSVLQRLDSDLLDLCMKTSEGNLKEAELKINDKKVITVVLASEGYPGNYDKGFEISGLEDVTNSQVFHAGTINKDGMIVTNGGRVLSVTAVADTFEEAYDQVYADVAKISFKGSKYREDIGPMVKRVYVEKKQDQDSQGENLKSELNEYLNVNIEELRILTRYDFENISEDELNTLLDTVLADKTVDNVYVKEEALDLQKELNNPLVLQYRTGQYDQKEQGLYDTLSLLYPENSIAFKIARVYDFEGSISDEDFSKIEGYLYNPVDQEKGQLLEIPTTIVQSYREDLSNEVYREFINFSDEELLEFLKKQGYGMNFEDIKFVQDYFKSENRDPNITEMSILDTYWSDHCRHTTFNTRLNVKFKDDLRGLDKVIQDAFNEYIEIRSEIGRTKDISLMDLGTIVARYMRTNGLLLDEEVTSEVNACSVKAKVGVIDDITGEVKEEDYLIMFKNETHNHPTEVEPYGGANTCIGGGIRDPLSGRSFVYQAMRLTGSGNPLEAFEDTLEDKLPQRKIATDAAEGYSTYGNQIGCTAGYLDEIFHDNYRAKRMECGALVAAAPAENVLREEPADGDVVIYLGAPTGRDGVGAATGSSKEQTVESLEGASAEVQKGNPSVERKIIRLFRNPKATKLIKKCNDFGAGGVSVAIGELTDSLEIFLDRVPLKYPGLTPREIAISESQERMALVVAKSDVEEFSKYCYEENLEPIIAANVTDTGRVVMYYKDEEIANLKGDFLNSGGVTRFQEVSVASEDVSEFFTKYDDLTESDLETRLTDLNVASRKPLLEKFDFTIGRGTTLAPLGGENQITPIQGMVGNVPSLKGRTNKTTVMTYGFNPYLSEESQFLGGYYAVIESLAKVAAAGADALTARLSFQEFFESMGENEEKWSKPLKALLGAFKVTKALNTPPIGGKDSMSGTFKELDVPPTLISFAVAITDNENIISPELKGDKKIGIVEIKRDKDNLIDLDEFAKILNTVRDEIEKKNIVSAYAITHKGTLPMLFEMALGNDIGFNVELDDMYSAKYGSFIVEYDADFEGVREVGTSGGKDYIVNNITLDKKLKESYKNVLSEVYGGTDSKNSNVEIKSNRENNRKTKATETVDKPRALIVVFPGANGEYDLARAFEVEGAEAETYIFKTLNAEEIEKSKAELAEKILSSQILAIPGGSTMGDEPTSGSYIAQVLKSDIVSSAIEKFLEENDGLIIGICNGFQGLLKTGLLTTGEFGEQKEGDPALTFNTDGHVSALIKTKAVTNDSPWLSEVEIDREYLVPVSNSEGRFVCSEEYFGKLVDNNQIAGVYIENPTGSSYNIESIISPNGKIIGKMTHIERYEDKTLKNIPGVELQPIIRGGVNYFKG